MKKLVSAVAFAALCVGSVGAYAGEAELDGIDIAGDGSQATPYDIGALPTFPSVANLEVSVFGTAGSSFEEFANFTAPAFSTALGAASSLTLSLGGTAIQDLFVEVWSGTHPGGPFITSFFGNGATHTFSLIAGGQYHIDVSGTLMSEHGTYEVGLAIAPIPEPETYAMLLAGLGLMGFVARRRQRKLAIA